MVTRRCARANDHAQGICGLAGSSAAASMEFFPTEKWNFAGNFNCGYFEGRPADRNPEVGGKHGPQSAGDLECS